MTSTIKVINQILVIWLITVVVLAGMVVYITTIEPASKEVMGLTVRFISELTHQWVGYLF